MQRILTLSFLVLLALGFASQLQAARVECPFCHETDYTVAHYECQNCMIPTEWTADAYSDTGNPPPDDDQCPECDAMTPAWAMSCGSEICRGAYVWFRPE